MVGFHSDVHSVHSEIKWHFQVKTKVQKSNCRWVCNEPENLLDKCYIKCVRYIWCIFSGAWWPLGWVKFHTCMYIIELNKSNIHTYLFTAVLSKGAWKLLKYSYNKYCNLVRVNTLQSTNRNQWSIYMAQTNIFATRTGMGTIPGRATCMLSSAKQAKRSMS